VSGRSQAQSFGRLSQTRRKHVRRRQGTLYPLRPFHPTSTIVLVGSETQLAPLNVRTRLAGYAREETILREVDELNHLVAFDRRKSLEKVFYCEIFFEVVNQRLYRNPRALEARFAAQPSPVHPNDFVQRSLLFRCHMLIISAATRLMRERSASWNKQIGWQPVRQKGSHREFHYASDREP